MEKGGMTLRKNTVREKRQTAQREILFLEHLSPVRPVNNLLYTQVPDSPSVLNFKFKKYRIPKSDSEARIVSTIINKDTADFYIRLYAHFFHKNVNCRFDYRKVLGRTENEGNIHFRPDILFEEREGYRMQGLLSEEFLRREYTEVKASSASSSKFMCRFNQMDIFLFALLRDIEDGVKNPLFNYAFFRYGDRTTSNGHVIPLSSLKDKLSYQTKDLLILPMNMVLFLFACESNTSLAEGDYKMIHGSTVSLLHEKRSFLPSSFLNDFEKICLKYREMNCGNDGFNFVMGADVLKRRIEKARQIAEREHLCLEDIAVRHMQSDEISDVLFQERRVSPFRITQYYLKNENRWIEAIAEHHRKIIGSIKGLSDLYEIMKEKRPF